MTEQTLTAKGWATRQRVIEGAAAVIRERGPAKVSLDDIRAATNTSKSQLFHYFPDGRAGLFLAVTRHEAELVLADQQPHLDALTSWRAWAAWRDLVVQRYREQGRHCPLSVLVGQIGPTDPAIGAVVADLLGRWRARIETGIREMQERGKIADDLDASRHAAAMLAGIQGGVLVMLATGDLTSLEAALDLGITQLRGSVTRSP